MYVISQSQRVQTLEKKIKKIEILLFHHLLLVVVLQDKPGQLQFGNSNTCFNTMIRQDFSQSTSTTLRFSSLPYSKKQVFQEEAFKSSVPEAMFVLQRTSTKFPINTCASFKVLSLFWGGESLQRSLRGSIGSNCHESPVAATEIDLINLPRTEVRNYPLAY